MDLLLLHYQKVFKMNKLLFITLLSFFQTNVMLAQFEIDYSKMADNYVEWNEGTIFLMDGKKLSGLLKYNSKTGLLGFESGALSKSFTARTVLSFSFYDAALGKSRNFISIEYQNLDIKDNSSLNPLKSKGAVDLRPVSQFFEVLFEAKTFALLSAYSNVQVKTKESVIGGYNTGAAPGNSPVIPLPVGTSYSQTEMLFIFDDEGNIKKWIEITKKETEAFLFEKKSTKRVNLEKDILEDYTAPHYEELKEYAKENKLSFKKKEDILSILQYYNSLLAD
jgi:hypothetical protein